MRRPTVSLAPLSHERLAIMLAVAAGPVSASEITRQAIADSTGLLVLKRSSLFRLLLELAGRGLIARHGQDSYRLTERGWKLLELESHRAGDWSQHAQERLRNKRYGYP
jgi:DNA-binding IclR family transcriptional regulator